jgi:hypothetical protein
MHFVIKTWRVFWGKYELVGGVELLVRTLSAAHVCQEVDHT